MARRGKTAKVSKRRTKVDKIAARVHLGDEPMFDIDTVFETEQERRIELMHALNWYSYFFDRDSWAEPVLEYITVHEMASGSDRKVNAIPRLDVFSSSGLALMRMSMRGWKLDAREKGKINATLEAIFKAGGNELAARKLARQEKVSKLEAPDRNWSPLTNALEELEDAWMTGETPEFNLYEQAQIHNETKQNLAGPVTNWLTSRLAEYELIRAGDDVQAAEAYSISRTHVRQRIAWLKVCLTDVDSLMAVRRRRPKRTPKIKSAGDQTKKFRFMTESQADKMVSLTPEAIVGASMVLLYNTKYRAVSLYQAADEKGIQVNRSKLTNLAEGALKWKLRKPTVTIPSLMETNSKARVAKILEELTTTPRAANGQSNELTIILKVIK